MHCWYRPLDAAALESVERCLKCANSDDRHCQRCHHVSTLQISDFSKRQLYVCFSSKHRKRKLKRVSTTKDRHRRQPCLVASKASNRGIKTYIDEQCCQNRLQHRVMIIAQDERYDYCPRDCHAQIYSH